MTLYHHQSAHKVAKEVLNNWRNGKWENEFVSNAIFRTHPSSIFPSPDADFLDQDKNTKISIEFTVLKTPAQPQSFSFNLISCGAESVPKKNLSCPEVAIFIKAS